MKRIIFILVLIVAFISPIGTSGEVRASPSTLNFHSGFEMGDFTEWSSIVGSVSIDNTIVHTGDYSMRCNASETVAYASSPITTARRISFWIYIATAPSSSVITIVGRWSTGYNTNLNTSRQIGYAAQYTSALDLDTWYRICVACDSSNNFKIYVNGIVEASGTGGQATFFRYVGHKDAAETADLYFDDIVQDPTDSTDDLGDIRVLRALPNAEGFHQEQSSGAYTDIDEVPGVAGAGGGQVFMEANGTLLSYTANFENRTDLGPSASDDIQAVASWFYYDTAGGGANEYFLLVRDNSTDYPIAVDDSKIDRWVSRYDTIEPNSSTDWDWDSFDAFQAGMETDDANKDLWINTVYLMVAYKVPAGPCSPNIVNTPISYDFGVVAESSTTSTTINYFTVTNNSGGAVSITIQGTDMTGGVTWTLSDTATPGTNTYGLKCGLDDDDDNFDIIVKKNATYNDLVLGLADSASQDWGLQLLAPSTTTDGDEKTGTVTLTATCD